MSVPNLPPEPQVDEATLRSKLLSVPATVVEKALVLYVILTDRFTPVWVRALVAAALVYLLNPLDAIPDALPGIGLVDDLAVLALTLERLSRFATPRVRLRARCMAPEWLARRDERNTQSNDNNEQGVPHDGQEEDHKTGRGRVPFVERFRILP